ncbi:hypothetical protein ABEG18_04890 [Alsobacter sp. KACC 23698]|jgi:hypothetical protein|uniref:Uncharacterized protein n=1 Tax=Alsobacter sp. KACC 23698 TaxID=3149229 RepID=A0AAU7JIT5_9HYPH
MTDPADRPTSGKPLRRLWWLMALKVALVAFAIYVALRAYHLV